jgi:hypothetical protein
VTVGTAGVNLRLNQAPTLFRFRETCSQRQVYIPYLSEMVRCLFSSNQRMAWGGVVRCVALLLVSSPREAVSSLTDKWDI